MCRDSPHAWIPALAGGIDQQCSRPSATASASPRPSWCASREGLRHQRPGLQPDRRWHVRQFWHLLSRHHYQRRHRRYLRDFPGSATQPAGPIYGLVAPSLAIGPNAEYQGTNTGVFQNRIMPSGTAIWAKGRHSVSFGGSWSYTQLNTRDHRTGTGNVASPDFVAFANNWVSTIRGRRTFTASTFPAGQRGSLTLSRQRDRPLCSRQSSRCLRI